MSADTRDVGELMDRALLALIARGATPEQAAADVLRRIEQALRAHPAAHAEVGAGVATVADRHGIALD